jgi:DNA recombination protein RmuC
MSKKLRDVEALPGEQAAGLLGALPDDEADGP